MFSNHSRRYPNVSISIPGPYAGSLGTEELIDGALEGVFVSRELRPADISSFRDKFGYDPTSIPIAQGSHRQFGFLDTMGFIVNNENPIEHISFTELDAILSTTRARGGEKIRKWGQLGVKGPLAKKKINIYGIAPWNGFEEFIRQRVLSFDGVRGECKWPLSWVQVLHFWNTNCKQGDLVSRPMTQTKTLM